MMTTLIQGGVLLELLTHKSEYVITDVIICSGALGSSQELSTV